MKKLYFDVDGTVLCESQLKLALADGAFKRAVGDARFGQLVCIGNMVTTIGFLESRKEPIKSLLRSQHTHLVARQPGGCLQVRELGRPGNQNASELRSVILEGKARTLFRNRDGRKIAFATRLWQIETNLIQKAIPED